jgi:hypothetical protein
MHGYDVPGHGIPLCPYNNGLGERGATTVAFKKYFILTFCLFYELITSLLIADVIYNHRTIRTKI